MYVYFPFIKINISLTDMENIIRYKQHFIRIVILLYDRKYYKIKVDVRDKHFNFHDSQ